jgi:hypothetical protein
MCVGMPTCLMRANVSVVSSSQRAHEFEPLDLERLRYVSQVCATPAGPGHFHDNPGEEF